jgi:hypothetical protein
MFTKEDYGKYFDQIAQVERKMIYGVYDLGHEINDPSIARVLEEIGNDEVRHYGYVLKMLALTVEPGQSKSHREVRGSSLGTVLLRGQTAKEIKASCVNLSKNGIYLECAQDLSSSGVLDLEIRLLGEDKVMVRRGRVVWSKEVETDFYISSIKFEA